MLDPITLSTVRKAHAIVSLADTRGWERPAAFTEAQSMYAAARAAADTLTNGTPLRANPKTSPSTSTRPPPRRPWPTPDAR